MFTFLKSPLSWLLKNVQDNLIWAKFDRDMAKTKKSKFSGNIEIAAKFKKQWGWWRWWDQHHYRYNDHHQHHHHQHTTFTTYTTNSNTTTTNTTINTAITITTTTTNQLLLTFCSKVIKISISSENILYFVLAISRSNFAQIQWSWTFFNSQDKGLFKNVQKFKNWVKFDQVMLWKLW